MPKIYLDGNSLTFDDVLAIANDKSAIVCLDEKAKTNIKRAADAVDDFVMKGEIVYGITTGFGAFKDRIIPTDQVELLQHNILVSHAVGVGPALDEPATRAMMLIRANTLAKGHSGIRVKTLELLCSMLNHGIHPVVPSKGSLGASGDLAPLAHMALPLIGLGEVIYQGRKMPSAEAFSLAALKPIKLAAKEGLALTNGTAFMAAVGLLVTHQAEELLLAADIAGSMSLEALNGTPRAFDPRIHEVRPHPRQIQSAAIIRELISGSEFTREDNPLNVQDAYSLRCIPQVHGAIRDAILYARWVIEIELNSVTDNPLIFFDIAGKPSILSGGNFHGEPLAIALDFLSIALTELGNISERRTARLVDASSNGQLLPAFLIKDGGLNSGFMLMQYTAAALASENKVYSHPSSTDSIPCSANIEDHVSMGPNAACHACEISSNLEAILAIELMAAAQAIDFRKQNSQGLKLGKGTAIAYALIRGQVPFIEKDTLMYPYLNKIQDLIQTSRLTQAVSSITTCINK